GRILHHQTPGRDEHRAAPGIAGRQHAVEEIDPARNRFHHVDRMSHPHQITRPVHREDRAVVLDHIKPEPAALSYPQATEREAIERHDLETLETAPPLRGLGAALVDPEERHLPAPFLTQPAALA